MLLIALSPAYTDGSAISTKMAGVVLASLSSGGGELSFISLTHYYGPFSLAAWGSGTGGAGLIGAGVYALTTTTLGLSSKTTLFASAFLPTIMLASFFLILPRDPLERQELVISAGERGDESILEEDRDERQYVHEREGLLQNSEDPLNSVKDSKPCRKIAQPWIALLLQNLRRSRSLFLP